MCTSIVVNKRKNLVGFNLDLLFMKYRVSPDEDGVYIEVFDEKEGFMPLFGANSRGDFVAMPTLWPTDRRSDPKDDGENIIRLNIALLKKKKTFKEICDIARLRPIYSIPRMTFMSALSDENGNVLQIIPGQGYRYLKKPLYSIMTNFSPLNENIKPHPLNGLDRYQSAETLLKKASDDFDVDDLFEILKAVSQDVCPTVVSMVFDVKDRSVYWCHNRNFSRRERWQMKP